MQEIIYRSVYVDLDAILDTRFATLKRLDEERGFKYSCVDEEYYRSRFEDSFEGLSKEVFYEAYAKRDKKTLAMSDATFVMDYLFEFVFTTLHESIDLNNTIEPRIYINYYPYVLEEDELESIRDAVYNFLKAKPEIVMIRLDDEELTTKFVREKIGTMLRYEYASWLEAQANNKNILRIPMVTTDLLVPAIYFKERVPREVLEDMKINQNSDPFKEIEKSFVYFIQMEFMSVNLFNAKILRRPHCEHHRKDPHDTAAPLYSAPSRGPEPTPSAEKGASTDTPDRSAWVIEKR